ncbi:MAG: hypothetical protein MR936_05180 [Eubacterium sp.]|nr:hypothetical protein [Eubacterium sp.]
MKIELWYDAVAQETDILINEVPIEKNDIYGFLYPVRTYPIQSWLYPNGSWKGIEYQLIDLARDEIIELLFHGRKYDYEDLSQCLSNHSMIKLKFEEWDVSNRYDDLFSNILSTIRGNDAMIRKLLSSSKLDVDYAIDFNIPDKELIWSYSINEDVDLLNVDNISSNSCYFVYDSFFTSYEKLQELLVLTRSLKIPANAIYCIFKDEQKKADYEYYAHSYKRMNFMFYLEDSDYANKAKNKYGFPHIVKLRIKYCGELLKSLCASYLKLKESTQDEFNRLKKNIVNLSQQEKQQYQNIKQLRDKLDQFRYGMELIYKYIDILFSVSKENKEEVLHYECIDKLVENVSLYLDAKSYSGVN